MSTTESTITADAQHPAEAARARALLAAMQERMEASGIGFEDIKVFGAIRCNVHVICVSLETAERWAALLSGVFPGAKVKTVPHVWDAAKNKGTSLLPTKRNGFLVAVAA